ncbi:MAG: hypothetical protein JWM33_1235 [Caulobacteraceae bacterium]|nr:hypothetical protein [Caulobacteraceae bacterium]
MPNLENLKKQAKLIMRWHREGRLPIAHRIREALPDWSALDDRQIMAADFRLANAQEVIARENGFSSWEALKSGLETMTQAPTPETAKLLIAFPQVFVADITAACGFYGRLGFATIFAFGEPPFYANVMRDNVILNLRKVEGPVIAEPYRDRDDVLAANIVVENVKALYLEFQAAGVEFNTPLCLQPWGATDFSVRDPDGNRLLFASRNGKK